MLLFLVVIGQADVTNQRVQAIIAGLMVVAASLALLTAWYWRVTDPRRRAEPQPSAPTGDDAFVPVETKPKRTRSPWSPDDSDGGGTGPSGSGPDGGEVSAVGASQTQLDPDDLTGDVTILSGSEADATLDLRAEASTRTHKPLEPLPPRPAPEFVDGKPAEAGYVNEPQVEQPRVEAPEFQEPELAEALEIDLRQPAPEPEPAAPADGLSVDEWLSLQGGD